MLACVFGQKSVECTVLHKPMVSSRKWEALNASDNSMALRWCSLSALRNILSVRDITRIGCLLFYKNKVKTLAEMHTVAPVLNEILDWLIPRSKLRSLSVDSNEPKDITKTDKAAQNCRTPKSLTLEIHHGGWFTPTPSRSYIGGQVSSVNVVDIDYLNVDDNVLDMSKYVKDYKIILVYVEHRSSNVDTSMFDSSPDVNRNVKKEWEKSVVDPFDDLDEILGDYANTGKQITRDESTWKQMLVHVGTSSTTDDFSFGKFKEVEVEAETELKEESDTKGNDTSGSDSKDLDYDPKHDDVFDDDEHIVEEVHVNINNFSFTIDPKHDTSIGAVDVQEDDLNVIDYDSFGSDLDDEIDSERRIQLRELRRLSKKKTRMGNHVIKSLATNPDIPVRAVQDQMQKQFEVGVSKMKAFRAKRIASDIMTGSYREQNSLLREYGQELIYQNLGTSVRIDVQQEPNPESLTRIFRRVYVCLGALKQGFRACGREILGLDGCFILGPWPSQILTAVRVDANNGIYPVAYVIVEAKSKASWCWFLNLLGDDLGIEANFNYTFISDRQKFKGGVYKEMLWNVAKATSEGEFKKNIGELKSFNSDAYDWLMRIPLKQWTRAYFLGRAKCDLLINNICEVFNRQLVDGRDRTIITSLEYIKEYLIKRIVVVQKVIAKTVGPLTPSVTKMKWELTGIPCKHVVAAIYNMSENLVGVNPCNGRDMWLVVESRTVIIPPLYKPPVGRPPKKNNKSNDEIASQSASLGKLSRKGKSISCGKCGNVGHNRNGCRGQGGSSSQDGARKVYGQAVGSKKVSCQAAGVRNVSGQAAGARKASSQPSAAQSTTNQGPMQDF
ncbi:hypothetical protein Tco_0204916 [Tanacetum coccineum]